jgi:hypothetical protein
VQPAKLEIRELREQPGKLVQLENPEALECQAQLELPEQPA